MRYVALVVLLVSLSARDAVAYCVHAPWFGVPETGTLPPKGSLYIQQARPGGIEGTFRWAGGTGSIQYIAAGDDVVRVDYEAGSSHKLEVRLDRYEEFTIGDSPRPSGPPIVIDIGHSEYHGEFVCAASSMAIITIDRPVAAFRAVWTTPCSAGRCIFADKILASRTVDGHGTLRFGNLGCGALILPAMPELDPTKPTFGESPKNLELTLTAIEFDGRETHILGVPSWSALERGMASNTRRERAVHGTAFWPLGEWAGLVGIFLALVALTVRAARRIVR